MENKKKSENKKDLIKKLWDIAEKGSFRPYSEFRKDNNLSQ